MHLFTYFFLYLCISHLFIYKKIYLYIIYFHIYYLYISLQ